MVVKYELKKGAKMTPEQMQEVEKAAQMPIVYDEDSPELTEEMARAFSEARVKKPYRGKKIVLYISADSFEKANERYGENYTVALGNLLEEALQG